MSDQCVQRFGETIVSMSAVITTLTNEVRDLRLENERLKESMPVWLKVDGCKLFRVDI